MVTACGECGRTSVSNSLLPDDDGALYCPTCWADYLIANNIMCHVCLMSVATVRDAMVMNNVCAYCCNENHQEQQDKDLDRTENENTQLNNACHQEEDEANAVGTTRDKDTLSARRVGAVTATAIVIVGLVMMTARQKK